MVVKRRRLLLCPMLPDCRKSICFSKDCQASSVCPSGNSYMWMKMSKEHWRKDTGRKRPKSFEKTRPSATLSATNLTKSDLWSNPGLRGESPVSNCPKPGTAMMTETIIYCIYKLSSYAHSIGYKTKQCRGKSVFVTRAIHIAETQTVSTI